MPAKTSERFENLSIRDRGGFDYRDGERNCNASAAFSLILIRMAWDAGCDLEDLADGFGAGLGTMGGDWSGIRDSSDEAEARMVQRALNFIAEKLAR